MSYRQFNNLIDELNEKIQITSDIYFEVDDHLFDPKNLLNVIVYPDDIDNEPMYCYYQDDKNIDCEFNNVDVDWESEKFYYLKLYGSVVL